MFEILLHAYFFKIFDGMVRLSPGVSLDVYLHGEGEELWLSEGILPTTITKVYFIDKTYIYFDQFISIIFITKRCHSVKRMGLLLEMWPFAWKYKNSASKKEEKLAKDMNMKLLPRFTSKPHFLMQYISRYIFIALTFFFQAVPEGII
jgi:hypothetical protein